MSRIREQFTAPPPEPLTVEPTGDLRPFVIFTQLRDSGPFIYAGWLEAADGDMALAFAREHYGQDQECVNVMAIAREHITSSDGLYGEGTEASRDQGSEPATSRDVHHSEPGTRNSTFRVFTQKKPGDLWIDVGTVDATNPAQALDQARRDVRPAKTAHVVWVVRDDHLIRTGPDDLVWRHTDQSYRLARGYGRVVRAKWIAFRDEQQLAEYEKDDLQEAF